MFVDSRFKKIQFSKGIREALNMEGKKKKQYKIKEVVERINDDMALSKEKWMSE